MHPLLEELDARDRRLLQRRAIPAHTPLMLATLAERAFSDPTWVFEAKLDGQRSLRKVGTGFGERELAMLTSRLGTLEQPAPPVADTKGLPRKGVHRVRPELVAQVGFGEWTPDGKLRHPRYLGLRDDKRPEQVVRERA
jgi:ATP-dependent DNA ligase